MRYQFLVDTYENEIIKVLSVWSMFNDADLRKRPRSDDRRGQNLLEHIYGAPIGERGHVVQDRKAG